MQTHTELMLMVEQKSTKKISRMYWDGLTCIHALQELQLTLWHWMALIEVKDDILKKCIQKQHLAYPWEDGKPDSVPQQTLHNINWTKGLYSQGDPVFHTGVLKVM